MAEDTVFHTFKKNVDYNISVRLFPNDKDGVLLTSVFPTVRVGESRLRDFKMSNQRLLKEAQVIEVSEELLDFESANVLDDEQIGELLKSYPKLKATLPSIDSLPILYKIQNVAKQRELKKSTLATIAARIAELEPEDEEPNNIRDVS